MMLPELIALTRDQCCQQRLCCVIRSSQIPALVLKIAFQERVRLAEDLLNCRDSSLGGGLTFQVNVCVVKVKNPMRLCEFIDQAHVEADRKLRHHKNMHRQGHILIHLVHIIGGNGRVICFFLHTKWCLFFEDMCWSQSDVTFPIWSKMRLSSYKMMLLHSVSCRLMMIISYVFQCVRLYCYLNLTRRTKRWAFLLF